MNRLLLAVTGALALAIPGYGATISSSTADGGASFINDTTTIFEGFTMGPSSFNLNSITIAFKTVGISSFSTSVLSASIYSGASAPTTFLTTLDVPAGTIQNSTHTFTPSPPLLLQSGTTYWYVITAPSIGNTGNLAIAQSNTPTGPFASFAGACQGTLSTPPQQNQFFSILVAGSAATQPPQETPEPAAFGLMGLGLAGLFFRRRLQTYRQTGPSTGQGRPSSLR